MKARTTNRPADICNRRMTRSNIAFFGDTYYLPPEDSHRNAPCPCGSGKKYKRCCGKNDIPQKTKKIYVFPIPIKHLNGEISDIYCVGTALCEDGRLLTSQHTTYEWVKHNMGITSEAHHKEYAEACPFGYELEWIEVKDILNHEGYNKAMELYRQRKEREDG